MYAQAVILVVYLLRLSLAQYALQEDYSGANFLSGFSFFTVRSNGQKTNRLCGS